MNNPELQTSFVQLKEDLNELEQSIVKQIQVKQAISEYSENLVKINQFNRQLQQVPIAILGAAPVCHQA
ncbi:hypothetical protein [Lyngbya aestuarii]|uniref:hypothetical protein n=1 Tax=Lyngbya aestuarii TaxID=118322 RepID=UPI00403DD995